MRAPCPAARDPLKESPLAQPFDITLKHLLELATVLTDTRLDDTAFARPGERYGDEAFGQFG